MSLSVRYIKPESLPHRSDRYAWNPVKYTKRGDVRKAWKADIAKLIARAGKRVDAMQRQYDGDEGIGGEWIPDHDDLYDAYGSSWTLYYKNTCGNIDGVLVEEE